MSSSWFSPAVDIFEVDLRYGAFMVRQTDLFLQDSFAAPFTRTYNSADWFHPNPEHAFGKYSNQTYDIAPVGTRNPYTWQAILLEDGNFAYFDRVSPGTSYDDAVFRHTETSSRFYKSFTYWNGDGWTTKLADGSKIIFPESYNAKKIADGAPTEIVAANLGKLLLHRDANRNLQEIRTPHNHTITLAYDDRERITRAQDDAGNWVEYLYGVDGMLGAVRYSSGQERHYEYEHYMMTTISDEKNNILLRNRYVNRLLVAQQFADGTVYQYAYHWAPGGRYAENVDIVRADGTQYTVHTGDSVPDHIRQMQ